MPNLLGFNTKYQNNDRSDVTIIANATTTIPTMHFCKHWLTSSANSTNNNTTSSTTANANDATAIDSITKNIIITHFLITHFEMTQHDDTNGAYSFII